MVDDAQTGPGTSGDWRRQTQRGDLVGRYVILGEIGAGGSGVVFAAYDPELDRKIAIKLLLPHGSRRDDARARLHREAQAMARLSHPNVVNVHDVGTVDAGVYIAMEFIDGSNLAQWLESEERSWREVADVFVQAGEGLAAAHERGLLHRDIKPENVMVDRSGRASVMDFGLASTAASNSEAENTDAGDDEEELVRMHRSSVSNTATRVGALLGTPAYMAPEQFAKQPPDARTDQFSFCVALWEGLYGERPFPDDDLYDLIVAVTENHRREPPKGTPVPARIRRALERGLSRDPDDRFPSMKGLLAELADTPSSQGWKWVAGGGLLLAGAAATVGYTQTRPQLCTGAAEAIAEAWGPGRRSEIEAAFLGTRASYASPVWQRIEPQLEAWAVQWQRMHTDTCEATRKRGEQSESVMDLRMACLSRARQALSATVAVLAEATPTVVQNAHQVVGGLPVLDACADVNALLSDVPAPDPSEAARVEEVRGHVAELVARREAGEFGPAQEAWVRADAALQGVGYEPVATEVWLQRGILLYLTGEYDAANELLRKARRQAARLGQWAIVRTATIDLIQTLGYNQHRTDEALAMYDLVAGLSAGNAVYEARVQNTVGMVLWAAGRYDEAADAHRSALSLLGGADNVDAHVVAGTRDNLGNVLGSQGKYEEAEREHHAALVSLQEALGDGHPYTATARNNLATALLGAGDNAGAEAEFRKALAIRIEALGADHDYVATTRNNLAAALRAQGHHDQAIAEVRLALASKQRALGPEHPSVATMRSNLGVFLFSQGSLDEAEVEHRAAIAIHIKAHGDEHPEVATGQNNLALVLSAKGEFVEAERLHRSALATKLERLGSDHPSVGKTRATLADTLLEQGRLVEAEAEARAAVRNLDESLGDEHAAVAKAHGGLGLVLHRAGRFDEAAAEYDVAVRIAEATRAADNPLVVRLRKERDETRAARPTN